MRVHPMGCWVPEPGQRPRLQGDELVAPVVDHAPDPAHVPAAEHSVDGHEGVVEVGHHLRGVPKDEQVLGLLVVLDLLRTDDEPPASAPGQCEEGGRDQSPRIF